MKAVVKILRENLKANMEWLGAHLGELITLIGLAVGALAGYFKLKYDVKEANEKAGDAEKTINTHVASPSLHRTPDFEQKIDDIKSELTRINIKLDRVLARRDR